MTRDFKISLSQEFYSDVVYLSQYDSEYGIVFHVLDKYSKATEIDGYSAKFQGTRNDGLGFQFTSTASNDTVTFVIDTSLTAVSGTHSGEIVFYDGNGLYYGSANVQIIVEAATHSDDTIDADVTAQQTLKQELQEIVNTAATTVGANLGLLSDLTTTDKSSAVGAINEVVSDVTQLNADTKYKVSSTTIFCDDIEDGYYSNNNGQKLPNGSSSNYKRTKNLIPVEEGALYVADRNTMCACFDKDGVFLSKITIYTLTDKFVRQTIPTGTTHVGLTATNAPSFTLTKVDASGVTGIEYPYTSEGCIHVEKCWCNGNGGVSSTSNFDMLIIPVNEGEKWYVSNQADYNLLCLDASGTLLEATYEARSPIGKVVTVPTGAKIMYVNLYRARTKGVNSEMSDYVARVDGKKILAIGDSLTWLDGRSGSYGGMLYFSGWQRQLRLAGHDVISAGFSGYPYATGLDIVDGVDYSIYKEIVTNAYDVSGYDMIILFGGTNDVLYNGALGDRPTDYSNRTFDASKFNGALGAIISYIRTNNVEAKIILATFPKSEAVSRVYKNARSRVDEIEYNADFWSCKYVNVWGNMNIQPTYDGFDQFFYDATHANFFGMERIGKIMLSAVENIFGNSGSVLTGTDATLSVANKPADAKATGDAITQLNADITSQLYIDDVVRITHADAENESYDLAYINTSGNTVEYANSYCSDFVSVVSGGTINYKLSYINGLAFALAFYDEAKTFISGVKQDGGSSGAWKEISGNVVVPNNATYVLFSMLKINSGALVASDQYIELPVKAGVGDIVDRLNAESTIWKNKKWCAFGTSITSTSFMNTETGEVTGKYVPYLASMSGLIVTNRGIAGGTLGSGGVSGGTSTILNRILNSSDLDDYDLITVEGFVNDFACGVAIGAVGDTENTTMYGALFQAIEHILTTSHATVVFITDTTGTYYEFHTTSGTGDYRVLRKNGIELYQQDYNNAIIDMCRRYGVPVIDAGAKSQINQYRPQFIIDQIHHTELGGKQYADTIWGELKNIPVLAKQ